MRQHLLSILLKGSGGIVLSFLAATPLFSAEDGRDENCQTTAGSTDRAVCLEEAKAVRSDDRQAALQARVPTRAGQEVPRKNEGPSAALVQSGLPTQRPTDSPAVEAQQIRLRHVMAGEVEATPDAREDLPVAEYSEVPSGRLQIELENGQIWRQISDDSQVALANLERNLTVNIDEYATGGYSLRLNELRQTIKVQRIR